MKKLLTSALLLSAACATAQTPFNTLDSVNINKINAMVLVHGDMWWNPTPSVMNSHCYFPNGTSKSISSTGAIWMSGYDGSNQLHVAAQTYRQAGNDYWPGPLDASGALTYTTSQQWAKIWKVNRTDIQHFQHLIANGTASATTIPAAIWTWPAKGNANAQGNAGAALTITTDMAPFIDVNADGTYQPLLGDYPDVKGDQALWWVFSDNGPVHTQSNGTPLKVEVHAMAYAYNRGTVIDNVIYYEYTVKNKSANNYTNFRIGQLADVDLGTFNDDYIGFDSTRSMGYVYNGNNIDGQYGTSIPMAGVMILGLTGGATATRAGSFTYYNNDNSLIGNPTTATDFDYYLRSRLRTGQHVTNDYAGPGTISRGYGPGPDEKFVYSGDVADINGWSECRAGNLAGDRRFVIASGDITFNAGSTVTLTMALITTDPDTNNACGDTLTLTDLHHVADSATTVYNGGGIPPLPDAVTNVNTNMKLKVYPNPAHNLLYIESEKHLSGTADIHIYNTVGQEMHITINNSGQRYIADISPLPTGVYYLRYSNDNTNSITKFCKE